MEVEITMRKHYGFTKESNEHSNKGKFNLFLRVHAEEGEDKDEPDTTKDKEEVSTPQINYEDLISKARKEEKDKLYPKITALEKEKNDLIEKHNNSLLSIGELQTKLEEAQKVSDSSKGGVDKEVVDLKQALAEKETELKNINETTEDINVVEERIRKEVEAEYEVKLYREQKLNEAQGNIIPELVIGGTKEEIDVSIAHSQNRFNEIVNKTISGVDIPPANASTSKIGGTEYKMSDLANMDPSSPEYAELRSKIGLK